MVRDLGTAAVHMRRVGMRALASTTVSYAATDILSEDDEKARNRQGRPSIDPVTGLQAVMAMNSVASALQQQNPAFGDSHASSSVGSSMVKKE